MPMRRGPSRRSPRPRAPIGQGPQRGVFWSWYLRFAPGAAVAWRGCAGRAARISGVGPSRAVCPEPRAGGRWREWVGLQVARLEDLGVGRDDGRGAPGRPPSGPWNLKPDSVAHLELGIEQCMMDRGLSQDSRLERKKRPKSQELSPTEAFARKELPSSMNLTRPAVDGCWRSTTADGWELGDELEKQKTHSAISGLTGHKQGKMSRPLPLNPWDEKIAG
ncbi:uncharacterized protein LOC122912112 isoform X2 [Neovison vison]|uniref:uncharacterized protein LOC122912112 isoform X2 n=1 Tax=Neovison vison TaxID=452646 RepID=UPI001CF099C6|nr:uncharacterized protein LOC122912112 isoform X2 [Neogale vison]